MNENAGGTEGRGTGAQFTTTHWSVVVAAGLDDHSAAQEALASLCQAYWFPLYAFIRRRGHDPVEAKDLTQEFFYRLLEKRYLAQVDRSKGRFRSFLLAAVEHFLANERRRARALKRGGNVAVVSIDDDAERRYLAEPRTELSPERVYEQRWAVAFLERVLARLRAEWAASGRALGFERMKVFLTGERVGRSYAVLAEEWGTTEAALKMSVSRLRQRYAELLRVEIAETVSDPAEVEDELRALLSALG